MAKINVNDKPIRTQADVLNYFNLKTGKGGRYGAYQRGGRRLSSFDANSELEIWFARLAGDAHGVDYGNFLTEGGRKIVEKLAAKDASLHPAAVACNRERIGKLPVLNCFRVVFAWTDKGYQFIGVFKMTAGKFATPEYAYCTESEKVSDSFTYDGALFEGANGRLPTLKECFK